MAEAKVDQKKGKSSRGTQDDLEILKQVICENRALFNKVLDKIRTHRSQSKLTLLDNAAAKYDAKLDSAKNALSKK